MGQLKPDATYIYEKADGVTYAREAGADPGTRVAIGWDHDVKDRLTQLKEDRLWEEIRRAANANPALQDALDRVKIIYALSKKDNDDYTPMWHPV